jgi:hypothetical protein
MYRRFAGHVGSNDQVGNAREPVSYCEDLASCSYLSRKMVGRSLAVNVLPDILK